MNTWIWHFLSDNGQVVTYRHGTKRFTIPRRMLVSIPKFITDADVADLRAAYLRDRDRITAASPT